jgi:hypothetical protein
VEAQAKPDLQQDNELETQTELDNSVGAEVQEGQTPNAPEVEEYDEIVLAGDEQASQYSPEEVLVHKLSKVRKRAQKAEGQSTELQNENADLKRQLDEIRKDFGYEDEAPKPKQEEVKQPQAPSIPEEVFNDHYGRAAKLKVPDYEQTERELRETIGDAMVDGIIAESEGKSEMVVYHLKKNPRSLDQFNHAIASGDIRRAQRFLWDLTNKLDIKPAKRDPVPAPEEIPQGSGSGTSLEAQLDSMRDKYVAEINSGGDGRELFAQMKALKSQIRKQ